MAANYQKIKRGAPIKSILVHPSIHLLIHAYRTQRGMTMRAAAEQLLKMGLIAAKAHGFLEDPPRDEWKMLLKTTKSNRGH